MTNFFQGLPSGLFEFEDLQPDQSFSGHMFQWWVNIGSGNGSGNGLVPDSTKPLPEPMLTDHQWSPVVFTRAGVKYVFVFANTNTNTNTAYLYLYLYLIKFQTMYLYLYLYLIHRIWCIWQIRFQIHFFLGLFLNTNLWKQTYMNILYKHVKECYSFSK